MWASQETLAEEYEERLKRAKREAVNRAQRRIAIARRNSIASFREILDELWDAAIAARREAAKD